MHNSVCLVILCYYPDIKQVTSMIHHMGSGRVIVVDNTPVRDVHSRIPKNFASKNIIVLQTEKNLGYAGGMNRGVESGLLYGADWVIVLNQDITMSSLRIDTFVRALFYAKAGIYGPYTGRLDTKRWTTILPSDNVDYISGACMAIHRKVIEKVGLFYEPYFMYYEDADYCVRTKRAGFPLIHVPVKGITHDDNPSLGKGSFLHEYYLARNHLLFVERLAPLRVKSHEYIRLPKTLAEHALHKNTGALEGIKDYFLRRFGEKKL